MHFKQFEQKIKYKKYLKKKAEKKSNLSIRMTIKFTKVIHETEKASLVELEDYQKRWLPHSQITFKGNNELEIEEWLFKKLKKKKVKKSWEQFMKENNLVYAEHCEVW